MRAKGFPDDVHDDFADLRNIDFSQYIAGDDDNAGSMNSPSSPSVGMMSKTPFKSPAPSEFPDDPIELVSSPVRPLKLRDYLPGLGSSVEPSFAMDDSQQTKVIAKTAAGGKAPSDPQTKYSYALSVSSDGGDGPAEAETCKLPDIQLDSPVVEAAAPAKGKKATRAKKVSPQKISPPKVSPPKVSPPKVSPPKVSPQKVSPPKRITRNRKVNGKKKPETTQDDSPAARNTKGTIGKKSPEARQDSSPAVGNTKKANGKKKPEIAEDDPPATDSTNDATPPKRPLLARMLSVLSEPGSLKWEDPLVGGHLQGSVESDGGSQALSLSSSNSAVIPATAPAAQKNTGQLVDDEGSIYSPSVPASFADPFELSQSLGCERPRSPAGPNKNQASPNSRLDLDVIDQDPPRGSPAKSPVKGARKGKASPEKRGREAQKAAAPSKRRRVQEPVKKRVVQPRPKAKGTRTHEEIEDGFTVPVADTHEPGHTATDVPRKNRSKAKRAQAIEMEEEPVIPVADTHAAEDAAITNVPGKNRSKVKRAQAPEKVEDEFTVPVVNTHGPEHTVTTDVPRTNSRTLVSETGSPSRINLPSESASPAEGSTDSPDIVKKAALDSIKGAASATQSPVKSKAVFQPQLLRPRVETTQADSPQPRQKVVTSRPEASSRVLAAQKSPSKPSGPGETTTTTKGKTVPRNILSEVHPSQQNSAAARKSPSKPGGVGKAATKGKVVPNVRRDVLSHAQPVPSSQQNPAFEAFRQHILGQLTTIEARQQHDDSDENDDPNGPEAETVKRASMNIVPQHMLGGVLSALTEVS